MTGPYPKRLIEVDLPIARISKHARNEKDSRCAHVPRLHIYPAARPLAACRAIICAALWPDPADTNCPATFRDKARLEMLAWTSHDRQRLLSAESRQRFEKARQKSALLDDAEQLRGALLDFIADFANWDNSTVKEYVGTSRALTHAAHQALGGAPGSKPVVVDPFAGGGAIPLEALRVGCEAFASDLNQVSIAICRVVLEHVPNYGERLLREVLRGVEWMQREAGKELGPYFQADEDGSKPIAYLWARTILSEAPEAGGNHPVEVPLLRTLWLATKAGTRRAMRWVRDKKGVVQTELAEVTYADGSVHTVRRPLLEVFEPKTDSDVEGRVPVVVEK